VFLELVEGVEVDAPACQAVAVEMLVPMIGGSLPMRPERPYCRRQYVGAPTRPLNKKERFEGVPRCGDWRPRPVPVVAASS